MRRLLLSILLIVFCYTISACMPPQQRVEPSPPPTGLPTIAETRQAALTSHETPEQAEFVDVTVYFTDSRRYAAGVPPFETGVTRQVEAGAFLPRAVLAEFFRGPTEAEQAFGLELVSSGFTGLSQLVVEDGTAHVYLAGSCRSNGATYTVAQPIFTNLFQFEEIRAIKIYDENGMTENPEGPGNSIPFCLEP